MSVSGPEFLKSVLKDPKNATKNCPMEDYAQEKGLDEGFNLIYVA
jgi:hypothetical protein